MSLLIEILLYNLDPQPQPQRVTYKPGEQPSYSSSYESYVKSSNVIYDSQNGQQIVEKEEVSVKTEKITNASNTTAPSTTTTTVPPSTTNTLTPSTNNNKPSTVKPAYKQLNTIEIQPIYSTTTPIMSVQKREQAAEKEERDRVEKAAAVERDRAERDRAERDRAERERQRAEEQERERAAAAERAAAERERLERLEKQRAADEERERAAAAERERLERERAEELRKRERELAEAREREKREREAREQRERELQEAWEREKREREEREKREREERERVKYIYLNIYFVHSSHTHTSLITYLDSSFNNILILIIRLFKFRDISTNDTIIKISKCQQILTALNNNTT